MKLIVPGNSKICVPLHCGNWQATGGFRCVINGEVKLVTTFDLVADPVILYERKEPHDTTDLEDDA